MATKIKEGRREHFSTSSGIQLPVDFNPSNSEAIEYDRDLGDPGEFPYTRGIRRNMYRGRLWTMRQYAGYATADESNARYKYLLSQGTTGLSVAFDLPTQIGLDSDDPLAAGEVGKVGVAIDYRYVCVLLKRNSELEHDFDQRISHSRSRLDRRAGSSVHVR